MSVSPSTRKVRDSPLGKRDRLLAALRQFQQRTGLIGAGPGQRARAEQVAPAQVAAVDGVVRDQLRQRPVGRLGEVGAADALPRWPASRIAAVCSQTSSVDVERAVRAVGGASR